MALAALVAACGGGGQDDAPAREMPPAAVAGLEVFQRLGCAVCHSFDGRAIAGPALDDIYQQPVKLLDGTTVVRDDSYLRASILDSGAQIVEGYRPTMINYGPMLREGELDALLALIRFYTPAMAD